MSHSKSNDDDVGALIYQSSRTAQYFRALAQANASEEERKKRKRSELESIATGETMAATAAMSQQIKKTAVIKSVSGSGTYVRTLSSSSCSVDGSSSVTECTKGLQGRVDRFDTSNHGINNGVTSYVAASASSETSTSVNGMAGDESISNCNKQQNSRPRLINMTKANIKPKFKMGKKVYAAWWPDKQRKDTPSWYPGRIKSYNEVSFEIYNATVKGMMSNNILGQSRYGSIRLYDIEYDDGDELSGVEDFYVFTEADYLLQMKANNNRQETYPTAAATHQWFGVKNVLDKESNDGWASTVGWYNVTMIDGREQSFSLLSDALRAYDASVITKKGRANTNPSELNLPEEFKDKDAWLKSWDNSSDEEDDSSDEEDDGDDVNDVETNIQNTRSKGIISSRRPTTRPHRSVLKRIRNDMSPKKQRRNIVVGLRVKVRFEDMWFGGVVNRVINNGHQIKIEYDDGTSEVADFPDIDIIVDDDNNGRHRACANAFIPSP